MSNKNLLQKYYVQSSINCIINLTENIYTVSIVERLSVCLVCGSFGVQNPGLVNYVALQTVRHRFNIYANMPVYVALALWRRDEHCKLVTRFGVIRRV